MENAGGSQVPSSVIEAVRSYFEDCYVQLGATYGRSVRATETVEEAHDWINRIVGGEGVGRCVLGPSSTQLVTMLVECFSRLLKPGDRVVVSNLGHEANIGPWLRLERFGISVDVWATAEGTAGHELADLKALLERGPKVVAFPHVSNIAGEVLDVAAITKTCHAAGAQVVVDGVAYAPHRPIDVAAWGVDFYFYSTYKVYGPHMGALFGREEAWAALEGPNHFFVPKNTAYKFELGGPSHEGCAGLLGLKPYIGFLSGVHGDPSREDVVRAFSRMGEVELPLQRRMIEGLLEMGARVVGPATAGYERVPTISVLPRQGSPSEIARELDRAGIGARATNGYAVRLLDSLGIDSDEGVLRLSMVHYNTLDEVDAVLAVLDRAMG